MLSKNKMVAARKAIEATYTGKCTVIEHQQIIKTNRSTGFQDITVLKDQPCKLSFSSISSNEEDSNVSKLKQVIKVFISPDVDVYKRQRRYRRRLSL